MRDIYYELMELNSDASFQLLGKSLGGVLQDKSLCFDNSIIKEELIKSSPDPGLRVRKWKLTVFQKIMMRKMSAPMGEEKKFALIYFLNPNIFLVNNEKKNMRVNGFRNNMFFTSEVTMDFSVVPKQPFYVLIFRLPPPGLPRSLAMLMPGLKAF